jgi:hypothetical protein
VRVHVGVLCYQQRTTVSVSLVSMTALLPLARDGAMAFGWAKLDDDGPLADERYWIADLRRDGVAHRLFPAALTERLVDLTGRPASMAVRTAPPELECVPKRCKSRSYPIRRAG